MLHIIPERILITRLRFIGDVVLTTPVIRALRRAYPQAEIRYLAEPGPASILKYDPDLNEVIVLDRARISTMPILLQWREHLRFFQRIRAYRFDLVIDLFCNPRSALITLLSGARYRLGYDVRGRGRVYNLKIKRGHSPRVVDAYLDAVRTLDIPVEEDRTKVTIPADSDEVCWATTWLEDRFGLDHQMVIAINPGASWPAKIWGADQFGDLIDRLVSTYHAHIVMIQGPGQDALVAAVKGNVKHPVHSIETPSLTQLAALIQKCRLFISNDCGPMHIAVAVGTPTIGLFGPSQPEIWFPYDKTDDYMALSPGIDDCCGKDVCSRSTACIRQIPADDVFKAAESILCKS